MLNLCKAKKGYFLVEGFSSSLPFKIKRRLLELGFTKGVRVKILRKSLIGQAFLVEIRGYVLSLRKEIASCVMVKKELAI